MNNNAIPPAITDAAKGFIKMGIKPRFLGIENGREFLALTDNEEDNCTGFPIVFFLWRNKVYQADPDTALQLVARFGKE